MSEHSTTLFADGDFLAGTLTWGWQCFPCNVIETGFGNASTASEAASDHQSLPTPTAEATS